MLKFTTGDDAIDEIEDTPLEAIDMLTNENDALRKFIQGAVLPLGIEVDVKVNRDHNILTQKITKYKNPAFEVTKPLHVHFLLLSCGRYETMCTRWNHTLKGCFG